MQNIHQITNTILGNKTHFFTINIHQAWQLVIKTKGTGSRKMRDL